MRRCSLSTHVSPIPSPQRDHDPAPAVSGAGNVPLDVVRQLLAAVEQHSTRRLLVRTAELEIEIEHDRVMTPPTGSGGAAVPTGSDDGSVEDDHEGLVDVVAPTVGVVRFSPESNGTQGMVEGVVVGPADQVAQIEAMKTTTAVLAGRAGTIREVCVGDGEVVEFGQPLLRLEPAREDGAAADGSR